MATILRGKCVRKIIRYILPFQTVKNETAFVDSVAIEITFNNKTALPHDSIKLECDVKPKSAVESVVWYKEGKIVHNSRRMTLDKNLLVINETLQSDTGYYTCSVYSTSGNHNMTAFLTILESEQEDDNGKTGKDTMVHSRSLYLYKEKNLKVIIKTKRVHSHICSGLQPSSVNFPICCALYT